MTAAADNFRAGIDALKQSDVLITDKKFEVIAKGSMKGRVLKTLSSFCRVATQGKFDPTHLRADKVAKALYAACAQQCETNKKPLDKEDFDTVLNFLTKVAGKTKDEKMRTKIVKHANALIHLQDSHQGFKKESSQVEKLENVKKEKEPLVRKFPKESFKYSVYVHFPSSNKTPPSPKKFFEDKDILTLHRTTKQEVLKQGKEELTVEYSDGKAIIQQVDTNFSSAINAAAAMLILDRGGKIDISAVKATRQIDYPSAFKEAKEDIEKAGLKAIHSTISPNQDPDHLQKLAELISKNGSAIMNVLMGEIHGEPRGLIVDNLSFDSKTVRLRDPYHGWDITVSLDAFKKMIPQWSTSLDIIQIPSKK